MTVLSVVPANRLNINEIRSEIGSPATNLFDFKWSDHVLNDIQWLRADTFSWQSGGVYESAYQHLVDDFNNVSTSTETLYCFNSRQGTGTRCYTKELFSKQWDEVVLYNSDGSLLTDGSVPPLYWYTETSLVSDKDRYWDRDAANDVVISINTHTETIGAHAVTYYLAEDGHKIVLANMEETVANIYNETGVAWYYILDTANQRFKLPRTKCGFTGLRDEVGKYVPESLPNYDAIFVNHWRDYSNNKSITPVSGAIAVDSNTYPKTSYPDIAGLSGGAYSYDQTLKISPSLSNSTYKDGAPVQERATQMYLYFYVGNFSQSAIEQTAGVTTEVLNDKVDVDVANLSDTGKSLIAGLQAPSDEYEEVTLLASGQEYTAPSDGYFAFFSSAVSNSTIANKSGYFGSTVIGASGYPNRNICPVKVGDKIVLSYSSSGTLRFYYTVGNESEAI